jgi:hypothetical protein
MINFFGRNTTIGESIMANFDNVNVSPDMDRLARNFRRQVLTEVTAKMQEYLIESCADRKGLLIGLSVTFPQATDLFNDFLLFMNDGEAVDPVLDPTNPKSLEEGA